MKFPSWIQVPMILVLGLIFSLPFKNFANNAKPAQRSVASVPGVVKDNGGRTFCRVTVRSCPKFPEFTGVRNETHNDSHEIPLRCLDRAKHYSKACESPESVRAEFVRNGVVLNDTEAKIHFE